MENWTVKSVDGEDVKSASEKEQAVLDQAVESGEATPEAAGHVEEEVIKVNLDAPAPVKEEVKEEPVAEKVVEDTVEEIVEEQVAEETTPEDESDITEISIDEPVADAPTQTEVEDAIQATETTGVDLPENVQKLVEFMNETGGTLEDYTLLNRDISTLDNVSVVKEYYKQSKPHLDDADIDFLMDKNFHYDTEYADESEQRAKQLAFKEELYKAQKFHTDRKEKYYTDLKLNRNKNVAPEYQEAFNFYNEHKKQQEAAGQVNKNFIQATDQVFDNEFKGFDFQVGDSKKFRVKVGDVGKTKEYQKDITNFINEFVGEDGNVRNIKDYHKAIYAAKNADKLAQHFYEQGRADALKNSAAKAKNIDMKPRQDAASIVTPSGQKFKVISGDDSNKLRVKMRK